MTGRKGMYLARVDLGSTEIIEFYLKFKGPSVS